MALTRRDFLCAVPIVTGLILGCGAAGSTRSAVTTGLKELAVTRPENASARTILVCMPKTSQTDDVWKGLSDELGSDYRMVAVQIDKSSDSELIAEAIRRYQPSAIVLMNNPTVTAYRNYQRNSSTLSFPPTVVVMTSFLEGQTSQIVGITGITYEVPLITVMTNLRRLFALKKERVGVVVREPLRGYVNKQIELARREQVVVNQEYVSAVPNASELKRALRRLKQHADVLWILNDDKLLTPRLISDAWIPGLDERPWIPTIVGAGSLVSPTRSFGTFAVLPDHVALGAQAAELVLEIAENGWRVPAERVVQLPLSTTTTMDLAQVRERFVMQKDALEQVDRILE